MSMGLRVWLPLPGSVPHLSTGFANAGYSDPTTFLLFKANSAKVQEDLEAEFQSLFSLLEELKEGMLMKIKQDRASRTYELQVWGAGGGRWGSPGPPPRRHLLPHPSHWSLPPNLPLLPCPFPEMPPRVPGVQSEWFWCHLLLPLVFPMEGPWL